MVCHGLVKNLSPNQLARLTPSAALHPPVETLAVTGFGNHLCEYCPRLDAGCQHVGDRPVL
jgi:hypothetical protein